MTQTYFLTGALGCIGAWVVKQLAERGDHVAIFDLSDDKRRLFEVLDEDALRNTRFLSGDVTDAEGVRAALQDTGATRVIHLAGLQVPFCKADPAKGARVNVLGTIHLFEAARALSLERVVYASSAAVYGPHRAGDAAPNEAAATLPLSHYGVYKRANEGSARVYFEESGLSSVGLRPLTVYGVGRDQGMTSGPTRAMKAAVCGRPLTIPFSGATDFNYVADTAAAFVAAADRAPAGAHVYNLHGDSVDVAHIVASIEAEQPSARGTIQIDGPALPIPPALDGAALEVALPGLPKTPLQDGVRATLARFRELHAAGRLSTHDIE